MRIVVSECLLGKACRYDGGSKPCDAVRRLCERVDAHGVCPETEGGLRSPRLPAERLGSRVVLRDGTEVTEQFERGAEVARSRALKVGAGLAVLKAKSPSCGTGQVYDGSFTGKLVAGDGVAAELLREEGICVVDENVVAACEPSVEHPVAIVLGTGLGGLAKRVKPVRRIPYQDIEGFPEDAIPVEGHKFEATIGTIEGTPVVVYPGRVHLYQGYTAADVTALVRHAYRLGCRDIILAHSSSAVYDNARPGLGIIVDHVNLTGHNPLAETEDLSFVDTPFVGMADAYTPYLREVAAGVASDRGIQVSVGVYAGLLGPTFSTRAEADMLGKLGVSYAGMSGVCEAIMAKALGMNVLGLTLATHFAGEPSLTHEDLISFASENEEDFEGLVCGVLGVLGGGAKE